MDNGRVVRLGAKGKRCAMYKWTDVLLPFSMMQQPSMHSLPVTQEYLAQTGQSL